MSVLKNLFLITVSPRLGWDEINKSGQTTRIVLQKGLYPMLLVLAIVSFVPMLYDHVEWSVSRCVVHCIAEFVSALAAFYITSFTLGGMYKELAKSNSSTIRMNNFIAYNLMFYVFIEILNNATAYLFPPVFFLFFYLPVIAGRGLEYLGVSDEKRGRKIYLTASVLIWGVSYAIRHLLELIITTGA